MQKFIEWLVGRDPQLAEKYEGFAKLKAKVAAGGASNPGAVRTEKVWEKEIPEGCRKRQKDERNETKEMTFKEFVLNENEGPTEIISFGAKNGAPLAPPSNIIDVRKVFSRNPYQNKKLRHLRGTHPEVQADIMLTPNFESSYAALLNQVRQLTGPVYVGCTGGHHRSVFLAEKLGKDLSIPVKHRDINK